MANKKVFITGADGFIGSHLTQSLVEAGHTVRALSYYNAFNSWGWLEGLRCIRDVEVVSGDIRDPYFCKTITRGVDVVFHLAALIAIPYSYAAPQSYIDTNVAGTLNICQAALENACERVMHTSTSEVYGTAQYVPIDEHHPLQAQSPYSASKIGADAVATSFCKSFQLPVVIARPFNTYGPRQSARAIIPTIICQLAAGAREIRLGAVSPTRDFTYVQDTCRGMMALAASEAAIGQAVNIGSNREIAMGDLFTLIKTLMNVEAVITSEALRRRPASSEVYRLMCDNSRMKKLTGFEPACSLKEGLQKTIEWFAAPQNLKRYKWDRYNV
jgi:NAD dependent epimerase/dehydratase